jgi:tetratricopeptide (TPR) repeat protein
MYMAKLRQLAQFIQTGMYYAEPQRSKHWIEIERMIEQMTSTDFAVTYAKDLTSRDIPLFNIMEYQVPYLAEMMIRKNPVFAAKIVDSQGWTVLHHACSRLLSVDVLKVINLVFPYMTQEAILSQGGNKDTFLHVAAHRKIYKVAASIPPDVISIVVKKSAALPWEHTSSYVSIAKFLKEAMQIYEIEIILYPEEADNYFRKGVILHGMGKTEKAIKLYKKAVEIDPTYANKVQGIEICTPVKQLPITNLKDNPELMKGKIAALTQEQTELSKKAIALSEEITHLRRLLKSVEEHKGQQAAQPPSYEEEAHVEASSLPDSLPSDIALMGSVDTCVTLHSDS